MFTSHAKKRKNTIALPTVKHLNKNPQKKCSLLMPKKPLALSTDEVTLKKGSQ
jgi:hypothetical protein